MKKSLFTATMFLFGALGPVHSQAAGPKTVQSETVRDFAREIQIHFKYYELIRRTLVGWEYQELAVACHDAHGVLLQNASGDKQKSVRDANAERSQPDIKAWAEAHMANELQPRGSSGRSPAHDGTP